MPRREVCTRVAHQEVSGRDLIRSCDMHVGRRAWIVRAPMTPDHAGSMFSIINIDSDGLAVFFGSRKWIRPAL